MPRTDSQSTDWYQLPSIYDILHAPGTATEVTGLQRIQHRHTTRSSAQGLWLEPACGTARYLRVAAARGLPVHGLDLSEPMIRYARARFAARNLSADLRVSDMTSFTISRKAALAFCTVNTIRHLDSDEAMLNHFGAVANALRRNALYIVGLSTTAYHAEMPSEDVFTARRGTAEVVQLANYLPPRGPAKPDRFETVINHLVKRTPAAEHHFDNTYRLRAYSPEQWLDLLAKSPFELLELTDEWGTPVANADDAHQWHGYALWVLRKR